MAFSIEKAEEVKKKLLEEIDRLPQENKGQIKEYVKGLDSEGLEAFLKQNKIQIDDLEGSSSLPAECVFCSIIKGKIPSYKIAENKNSIAILEINPLSKAHTMIIPIEHTSIEKIPKSVLTFAQKIANKIKKKFKPEDIKIESTTFQGHALINVIPIYKNAPLKKIKAEESDLKFVKNKLETKLRRKRGKKVPSDKSSSTTEKKDSGKKIQEIPSFRVPS